MKSALRKWSQNHSGASDVTQIQHFILYFSAFCFTEQLKFLRRSSAHEFVISNKNVCTNVFRLKCLQTGIEGARRLQAGME